MWSVTGMNRYVDFGLLDCWDMSPIKARGSVPLFVGRFQLHAIAKVRRKSRDIWTSIICTDYENSPFGSSASQPLHICTALPHFLNILALSSLLMFGSKTMRSF
jgi:hypothetical protein